MLAVGGLQGNHLETDIPLTLHSQTIKQTVQRDFVAPDYQNQQARFDKFHNWPRNSPVNRTDLSGDGFIYTGIEDKVWCCFCDTVLLGWEPGDVVSDEHLKYQPNCPFKTPQSSGNAAISSLGSSSFLGNSGFHSHISHSTSMSTAPTQFRGEDVPPQIQNVDEDLEMQTSVNVMSNEHPASSSPQSLGIAPRLDPKHPKYMLENDRLKTFATWPNQFQQTPEDLAKAGFIFLGSGDKTKCFCCNGNLVNWEPDDDPFIEHARWFPNCGYINLIKGEEFVRNVSAVGGIQTGAPGTELSSLPPKVLAVMEQGYTREQIESTLERYNRSYDDFNDAENLLTFLLESDTEMTFQPSRRTEEEVTDMLVASEPSSIRSDTPSVSRSRVLPEDEGKSFEDIQSENREMKEQLTCKICMEEDACIVFLPCGHLVTCGSCAAAMNNCPLCRKSIKGTVRTYLG